MISFDKYDSQIIRYLSKYKYIFSIYFHFRISRWNLPITALQTYIIIKF